MQLWPSGLRRRIQDPLSMMRGFEPHWLQKLNINKNKTKIKQNDSCKQLRGGIMTATQTKMNKVLAKEKKEPLQQLTLVIIASSYYAFVFT